MSEQDFNLKVTVRNGRLLRRIREKFDTAAAMARECDITPSRLAGLVTMRDTPFKQDGNLTGAAEQVCSALGCCPDDLWPKEMAQIKLARATTEVEMSAEQVAALMSQETSVIHRDLLEKISVDLTDRERLVIDMRKDDCTLDEVGLEIGGVSRERVRQIESKAMRKMCARAQKLGWQPGEQVIE